MFGFKLVLRPEGEQFIRISRIPKHFIGLQLTRSRSFDVGSDPCVVLTESFDKTSSEALESMIASVELDMIEKIKLAANDLRGELGLQRSS